MAEQIGIGTLLGSDFAVTGYADEDGRALIRMKSRLDKLKWKRSPSMKWSREAARHFGAASTLAGGIWKNVPGGLRRLMDAGAFNRLVSTCRLLQEWDGNLGDFDGFRNLDLSEESYGPHRVVRRGSGWAVSGIVELMGEIDRVTVVSDERGKMKDESPTGAENWVSAGSDESGGMRDESGRSCAGPEALEGGALGQCDVRLAAGGESRRGFKSEYESECVLKKRRNKIRRMAGVVADSDFRHDTGRFWERVEDVYRGQLNPKVRFWEGRGMFDYGRVVPPRIVMGQRFLRSPYVSCWPYEGNLGSLDCLNRKQNSQNSRNSQNSPNGGLVLQNWESAERPDRRVRLWVQACEIGRVREAGGRSEARFVLGTVGCSALGSSGYVSPWTVIRGRSDESGVMRDESGLGAGFDERSRVKDEGLKQNLQDLPNLQNLCGRGLSLESHGGTGFFVVIAGIEVAEKRGRHWVRLPWCCKARVVDVVEQNSQDSQDSQDSQNSQNSQNFQDSQNAKGAAVDLLGQGMALEFKGVRGDVGIRLPIRVPIPVDFAIGGRWAVIFRDKGFVIFNAYAWIEIGWGIGIGQGFMLHRHGRDMREDIVPGPHGEIFGLGP